MRTSRLVALGGTLLVLGAVTAGSQSRTSRAQQELGDALFRETVFANPGADFAASCDSCHRLGADRRGGARQAGAAEAPVERFYSDGSPRSLMPGRGTVVQETTLRNTPTLLDLDHATRFGWDCATRRAWAFPDRATCSNTPRPRTPS